MAKCYILWHMMVLSGLLWPSYIQFHVKKVSIGISRGHRSKFVLSCFKEKKICEKPYFQIFPWLLLYLLAFMILEAKNDTFGHFTKIWTNVRPDGSKRICFEGVESCEHIINISSSKRRENVFEYILSEILTCFSIISKKCQINLLLRSHLLFRKSWFENIKQ